MKIKSYLKMMGVTAAVLCMAGALQGQTILIADLGNDRVGAFNGVTGATINASFITTAPESAPRDIAYGDGYIYVANQGNNTVGKYDATTGAVVNASFLSGISNTPLGIAYSNGNLFVSIATAPDVAPGHVSKYNAETGAVINLELISGLSNPNLLTAYGGNLYVPTNNGVVGLYSESGSVINASFITGLSSPFALVITDGSIFVSDYGTDGTGSVGKFDLATGAAIDLSLITGLSNNTGITVNASGNLVVLEIYGNVNEYTTDGAPVNTPWFNGGGFIGGAEFIPVPEPGTSALLGLGVLCVAVSVRKKFLKSTVGL